MNYYIHKNGTNLGPLDEASVRSGLACGQFSPNDLACPVGDSKWLRLADLLNGSAPKAASGFTTVFHTPQGQAGSWVEAMAEKVSSAAGLERLRGFSFKAMFSEVFRKHSDEEMERDFSVGAPGTTPSLESITVQWPQPWLFFRALAASLFIFWAMYFMLSRGYRVSYPAFLMFGSFAVPCSVLILFFELNILRNISLYQVIKLVLVGGSLSLICLTVFHAITHGMNIDLLGEHSGAGLTEEPAKLLAMLIVANKKQYRWTLNGLLIGACIGAGFEVIETAGYGYEVGRKYGGEGALDNLLLRGALAPLGGHILLSGVVGAGLWMVKGSRSFQFDMLKDVRFLRLLAVSVVSHMVWNSPFRTGIAIWDIDLKYIVIGFVLWIVILSLVQQGLKQVRLAQKTGLLP